MEAPRLGRAVSLLAVMSGISCGGADIENEVEMSVSPLKLAYGIEDGLLGRESLIAEDLVVQPARFEAQRLLAEAGLTDSCLRLDDATVHLDLDLSDYDFTYDNGHIEYDGEREVVRVYADDLNAAFVQRSVSAEVIGTISTSHFEKSICFGDYDIATDQIEGVVPVDTNQANTYDLKRPDQIETSELKEQIANKIVQIIRQEDALCRQEEVSSDYLDRLKQWFIQNWIVIRNIMASSGLIAVFAYVSTVAIRNKLAIKPTLSKLEKAERRASELDTVVDRLKTEKAGIESHYLGRIRRLNAQHEEEKEALRNTMQASVQAAQREAEQAVLKAAGLEVDIRSLKSEIRGLEAEIERIKKLNVDTLVKSANSEFLAGMSDDFVALRELLTKCEEKMNGFRAGENISLNQKYVTFAVNPDLVPVVAEIDMLLDGIVDRLCSEDNPHAEADAALVEPLLHDLKNVQNHIAMYELGTALKKAYELLGKVKQLMAIIEMNAPEDVDQDAKVVWAQYCTQNKVPISWLDADDMLVDFFEVLGIDRFAGQDEIKKAYRTLSKRFHTDGQEPDEARFKLIAEAYGTLSDEDKFSAYMKALEFFIKIFSNFNYYEGEE